MHQPLNRQDLQSQNINSAYEYKDKKVNQVII